MTDWMARALETCMEHETAMAYAFRRAFGIVGPSAWSGGTIVPVQDDDCLREYEALMRQRYGALDRRG